MYDCCPRSRGSNISLIGALSLDGLIASMSLTGSVNTEVFVTYIQEILAPQLWKGAFVVMDNLPVHKAYRIQEIISAVGAKVIFLPPYSPDLSPIELCWCGGHCRIPAAVRRQQGRQSKLKQCLRNAKARTTTAIYHALSEIINQHISSDDALGWFTHCGLFI